MNRILTIVVNDENGRRFAFANEQDRKQVEEWMKLDRDPEHHGMTGDFFLQPNTESRMFGDDQGDLFAVRISRVMRLDIQFNAEADPQRLRDALLAHFPWLIEAARSAGFCQLIFDSVTKALIAFCMRRFRFKASPNEYRADI